MSRKRKSARQDIYHAIIRCDSSRYFGHLLVQASKTLFRVDFWTMMDRMTGCHKYLLSGRICVRGKANEVEWSDGSAVMRVEVGRD